MSRVPAPRVPAPHASGPGVPAPPGGVPFGEDALAAILRECDAIDVAHGLATITGDRVRESTRMIRAHARDLEDAAAGTLRELEDCLQMAQARGDG